MINIYLYFFLLIELVIIGAIDFKTRKIANWWHLINLFVAICLFVFKINLLEWSYCYYSMGALTVGFMLYRFCPGGIRIMGGGDAKLFAILYLLMPATLHELFTIKLLYVTIIVGSVLIISNVVKNIRLILQSIKEKKFKLNGVFGKKFPFAPLIVMAWIWIGIEIY